MKAHVDLSNINTAVASLMIEELVRLGITRVCIAPGSRSTPLTVAAARHPECRVSVHYDERGLGYFALGMAKASGEPVAVVTTSGTAAVNLHPAVVEAAQSGVPLLLLTADRPVELREVGANQAVKQAGLFSQYTEWAIQLDAPTQEIEPAFYLSTIDYAVAKASVWGRGPVHINMSFREPLVPKATGDLYPQWITPLESWQQHERPFSTYTAASARLDEHELKALLDIWKDIEKGVIVLGPDSEPLHDLAAQLASALQWPVCRDIAVGGGSPQDITFADHLLLSDRWKSEYRPAAVIHIGGRMTSRRVSAMLADPDIMYWSFQRSRQRRNEHHRAGTFYLVEGTIDNPDLPAPAGDGAWLAAWQRASVAVQELLLTESKEAATLHEWMVPGALLNNIETDAQVLLGNSMPVRDADMYRTVVSADIHMYANRGASGIDGLLSTACGLAEASGKKTYVLLGDLSLLHDLSALHLLKTTRVPVTVVVVNNHGGGIFSLLPVYKHKDVFETYFGTPHQHDFAALEAFIGLPCTSVNSLTAFQQALTDQVGCSGLIQVESDRESNRLEHHRLQTAVFTLLETLA